MKTEVIGQTEVTYQEVSKILGELSQKFGGGDYHILDRNCNNFSDEFAKKLIGKGIPNEIISMPKKAEKFIGRQRLEEMMGAPPGSSSSTSKPVSVPKYDSFSGQGKSISGG